MIHFPKEAREGKNPPEEESAVSTSNNSSVSRSRVSNVLLLTCSAYASNPKDGRGINKFTRILCDNGSDRSWIRRSLADCLKLNSIRKERLSVFSFGSVRPVEKIYDVAEIKLTNRYDPNKIIQFEVLITDTITAAPNSVPNADILNTMRSRGLILADCFESDIQIEVLIGADVFWQIVDSTRFEKINKTITCVPTVFGFALQGTQLSDSQCLKNEVASNLCVAATDVQILWELEALGIKEKEELNSVDKAFVEEFEKGLKFVDGRYETNLMWKTDPNELANNFTLAKKQFEELKRVLNENEWVANEYKEIVNEQVKMGIIEQCDRDSKEYFMPHRAVVRADKETTKVRIVYNCSSKSKGNLSLNDCLETGPNLNPNILDIILNFRKFKIAFNADIEKAFLMIGISERDRKFLKFLWYSDSSSEEFKYMQMKRVTFGCKPSPFILSATIKHHIQKFENTHPKSVEMLKSSLYVDDLYFGGNSVNEVLNLSSDAVTILKAGGFNLRKLRSNSKELEELWVQTGLKERESVDVSQVKVLGLNWNPEQDELSLDLKGIFKGLKSLKNSKRCVLQTAASIFDPVGLIAPFVVRIKLLLQEIWERAIDWDEELPEDLGEKWVKWCGETDKMSEIKIPRHCLESCVGEKAEVHVFCDASLRAYGAVVYFRFHDKYGNYKVSFVLSKSRVAPLKKLTLPRLELMALVIGSRLGSYLKTVFGDMIQNIVYWSDSLIALYWVKGCAKRWKMVVANRVLEIQEKSNPSDWKFCPSEKNPADLLTRGISMEDLLLNKLWRLGPDWLQESCEGWPEQVFKSASCDNVEVLREKRSEVTNVMVVQVELVENLYNRISVWSKLQRIVAWCLRFIRNARGMKVNSSFLQVDELREAHDQVIKAVQRTVFSTEIATLEKGKVLKSGNLSQLNPFIDSEGLLRVGGRLKNANLAESVKHPLILPKKHPVTEMVIRYYHIMYLHAGIHLLSASIRQKYWIVCARSAIRKVVRNCVTCCRFRSEFSQQIMANLPSARVNPGRAFLKCGTDFAGPFLVTPRRGRGVKALKMYVCIFVCFIVKAVHLEIVSDLSTEACLSALKRFIARRGKPLEIYSDCGTNYIGAKNYWKACSRDLGQYLADEGVSWKLNIPSAPHYGGLWEAAVKAMKFHLRRVMKSQILTVEEFSTVLAEVEAALNSRPLVSASDCADDYCVLTPGHFLIGSELRSVPEPDVTNEKISIGERYKLTSQISQSFYKAWSKDYLTQLQARNKWKTPCVDLCCNDIVLIKDENLPPLKWRMARVTETIDSSDSRVRAVTLKTSTGELRRPIHKLVKLPIEHK
ncbi:uncharacterized protein LOC129217975 [Uloborus diversus]|uniref:uncharacterized protein LOC129217975 n=1 Tax=Uloborus diversus TaxID=327109 RepID=UPI0024093B56|nr:uncharacterized protein LOC129217975 [Uloborus diversus]